MNISSTRAHPFIWLRSRMLGNIKPIGPIGPRLPGSLPVAYLVTQVGNWGSGSDDVGLIQSTKAPTRSLSRNSSRKLGYGERRCGFNTKHHSTFLMDLISRVVSRLLDPRDPLLQSERTQGFAADPDYWKGEVFAYVGSIQNLKDLKKKTRGFSRDTGNEF